MSEEEKEEIKQEEVLDEVEAFGRITGVRLGHIREKKKLVSDFELLGQDGSIMGHIAVPYDKKDKIGSTYKVNIDIVPMESGEFYDTIKSRKRRKGKLPSYLA